jgi:DNA-binding NarL/FixJ family response regulator
MSTCAFPQIKIVVATPNPMTSFLLAQALEQYPQFSVVERVSDATIVESALEEHRPDVLLVSIHLKALVADRFFQLATILSGSSEVAGVVLLDENDPEMVVDAFRARAKGVYVCSESNTDLLQKCILRVVEGQIWADSDQLNRIIAALPSVHTKDTAPRRKMSNILTPREEEVVWQIAEGLSNREIATRLQLSENTVKNYVFRIFEKLGFSNRVEVVLYASSRMQQDRAESQPEALAAIAETALPAHSPLPARAAEFAKPKSSLRQ